MACPWSGRREGSGAPTLLWPRLRPTGLPPAGLPSAGLPPAACWPGGQLPCDDLADARIPPSWCAVDAVRKATMSQYNQYNQFDGVNLTNSDCGVGGVMGTAIVNPKEWNQVRGLLGLGLLVVTPNFPTWPDAPPCWFAADQSRPCLPLPFPCCLLDIPVPAGMPSRLAALFVLRPSPGPHPVWPDADARYLACGLAYRVFVSSVAALFPCSPVCPGHRVHHMADADGHRVCLRPHHRGCRPGRRALDRLPDHRVSGPVQANWARLPVGLQVLPACLSAVTLL